MINDNLIFHFDISLLLLQPVDICWWWYAGVNIVAHSLVQIDTVDAFYYTWINNNEQNIQKTKVSFV